MRRRAKSRGRERSQKPSCKHVGVFPAEHPASCAPSIPQHPHGTHGCPFCSASGCGGWQSPGWPRRWPASAHRKSSSAPETGVSRRGRVWGSIRYADFQDANRVWGRSMTLPSSDCPFVQSTRATWSHKKATPGPVGTAPNQGAALPPPPQHTPTRASNNALSHSPCPC